MINFVMATKSEENCWDYYSSFLTKDEADKLYTEVLKEVEFTQGTIVLFDKKFKEPRKTAMLSDKKGDLTYSGTVRESKPLPPSIKALMPKISKRIGIEFDCCFLNYYSDGHDYIGWHNDNGQSPPIASLSLGATRKFRFRYRNETSRKKWAKEDGNKGWVHEFDLMNGDLVYMHGKCQSKYKHTVPKQLKVKEPRINLTFRVLF